MSKIINADILKLVKERKRARRCYFRRLVTEPVSDFQSPIKRASGAHEIDKPAGRFKGRQHRKLLKKAAVGARGTAREVIEKASGLRLGLPA